MVKNRIKTENILENMLGRMPNRPIHLYVKRSSLTPYSDDTLEELTFTLELTGGMVDLSVKAIIPSTTLIKEAKIIIYDNKPPIFDREKAVFLLPKELSNKLKPSVAPDRRRLDTPGELAILAYAALRVAEYIRDRFESSEILFLGEGIYSLSAEYAQEIFLGEKCQGISVEANKEFIESNPLLFSPRFIKSIKTQSFENN